MGARSNIRSMDLSELTPELFEKTEFTERRRGYDIDQVETFLEETGTAVAQLLVRHRQLEERATNAEARLAETERRLAEKPAPAPQPARSETDEVERATSTLLMAKRTADATLAEAEAEAERVRSEATGRADSILAEARTTAAEELDAARRRTTEVVTTLEARRDAVAAVVEGLEKRIDEYRGQFVEAARALQAVADDPEVDILVEVLGGTEPALSLIMRAIENGKHVVTANKALIAVHGNAIFAAAKRKGVTVAYESAVAGGIPIIKALREGLAANSIQWLAGIINGTGNFILTEMAEKGRSFAEVLKEAQALGYAEADPTFDVEGIDAAHKLTILASNAFGISLQFDKVYTEGISKVTTEDVNYAAELGYRIKHLGITRMTDKGIEMRVHPTLISDRRLIANVNGVMNAVVVKGDSVG